MVREISTVSSPATCLWVYMRPWMAGENPQFYEIGQPRPISFVRLTKSKRKFSPQFSFPFYHHQSTFVCFTFWLRVNKSKEKKQLAVDTVKGKEKQTKIIRISLIIYSFCYKDPDWCYLIADLCRLLFTKEGVDWEGQIGMAILAG